MCIEGWRRECNGYEENSNRMENFWKSYLVTSVFESIWKYQNCPALWTLLFIWMPGMTPMVVLCSVFDDIYRPITLHSENTRCKFIRNICREAFQWKQSSIGSDTRIHSNSIGWNIAWSLFNVCCFCCNALENVWSFALSILFQNATISVVSVKHTRSLLTTVFVGCCSCVFRPSDDDVGSFASVFHAFEQFPLACDDFPYFYHNFSHSISSTFVHDFHVFCFLCFVHLCHIKVFATIFDFLRMSEFSTS